MTSPLPLPRSSPITPTTSCHASCGRSGQRCAVAGSGRSDAGPSGPSSKGAMSASPRGVSSCSRDAEESATITRCPGPTASPDGRPKSAPSTPNIGCSSPVVETRSTFPPSVPTTSVPSRATATLVGRCNSGRSSPGMARASVVTEPVASTTRSASLRRSATTIRPRASTAIALGVSKRASAPGPSTSPGAAPPARVVTTPSGAITRMRSL